MSILAANLKQLYQRPGLWLVYVIVGLLVFASLVMAFDKPSAGQGKFMGLVMLQFLIGLFAASLPAEILTKPFSYCLPGQRSAPRRFVAWVAVVTSIPGSLVFLMYPGVHWWELAMAICCSAFCAGLTFYWIGVGLAFGVRNSGASAGLVWLPLLGVMFFDLHAAAERTIVGHPLAIILLGLSSSAAAWIWLGNPNWARRLCATGRIFLFDAWNREKMLEHARKRAAVKWDKSRYRLDSWVERFFMSRMTECNHLGPGRYIWGGLYTTYGLALSRWKASLTSLVFVLAMVLYLSYSRPGATNILFVMAGVMVMHVRLSLYSCMMISGGRSERFFTAIVLAGTTTLLVTAALTAVSALSVALAPIMPDLTFRGVGLTFHVTSLRLLIVPSIIIPTFLALRLIIYRKPFTTFVAVTVLFGLMFVFDIRSPEGFNRLFNPVSLTCLLMASWLVLVIVLRHICMKRSLVGQSRTY